MINQEDSVYLVEDIQIILKLGRTATYELLKDPPFPVRKVLKKYRIPKPEFQKWLHGNTNDFLEG